MGFKEIREASIRAIEEGRIQHEIRGHIEEKNLLLTGDITPKQVVSLLRTCRGTQYQCTRHHQIKIVDVHIFKPEVRLTSKSMKVRWYIKLYFLEPHVWFISVHPSKKDNRS